MVENKEKQAVEAYSKGDISRAELERLLEREVDFSEALLMLRQYQLPLPHQPSNPQSVGVQLIRQLAIRQAHHG